MFVLFEGTTPLAEGSYPALAAQREALTPEARGSALILNLTTGDIAYGPDPAPPQSAPANTSRGRPKLGVVSGEVTLLPRHWQWLKAQRGGASATLRRLIDEARRAGQGEAEAKARQERCYRFMTHLGGDLPGYEDALRALFAGDEATFVEAIKPWPAGLRTWVWRLATEAPPEEGREERR
jgi:hypothetical protein